MGTVVDRKVDTSGKTKDHILYVKYSTLGVKARKAFFVPYRVYMKHHISSEIEVIYDPLNPQNVEVMPDLGSQPTMFFIASGLTFLGCIGAFYWARRLRREDAEPEVMDLDEALRKARRR